MPISPREIWHLVRDAQAAAYAAVKPGVNASEVDIAARDVIGAAGLDHFFTHRLGHGTRHFMFLAYLSVSLYDE